MSKPISPDAIGAEQAVQFPAAVFDAFNAEIASRFSNDRATVLQAAVVTRLVAGGAFTRKEIFESGYLNIEEAYRAAGWDVEYDKPGYNESGEAKFVFTRARR